jgi:YVTN family beta-propeller protein
MRTIVPFVVLLAACGGSQPSTQTPPSTQAPPATQTPSATAEQPAAPAAGSRLFVSDETGGAIVVVDPDARKVVQRIPVGKRPRGIHLSPDRKLLYVALSGSPIGGPGVDESKLPPADRSADGIGAVDVASGALVRRFDTGPDPETFAVSSDGKMLYVSNEETSEMTALDLTSGNIAGRVKVGVEPEGVTIRPDGKLVYVACEGSSLVYVVDRDKLTVVAQIPTPGRPRGIIFTPDGSAGFISDETGGAVVAFDSATNKPAATIKFPKDPSASVLPRPMGLAMMPDGGHVFVSLGRFKAIAEITVADKKIARTLPDIGARPWGIALSQDAHTLYSANGPSGDISLVDVGSGNVTARVAVGGSPWGVVVLNR